MRDLACPSVKLFAPATGAPGLFPFLLLMALLFGPSLAGGFCATAPLAARARAITATDIVRIVASFGYPPSRQCPICGQVPPFQTLDVGRMQKVRRGPKSWHYSPLSVRLKGVMLAATS